MHDRSPTATGPLIRWAIDAAVAVVLGAAVMAITFRIDLDGAADRPVDAVAVACVVVAALGVSLRRTAPALGCAVAVVATWLYTAGRFPGGPIHLLTMVAIFSWAVTRRRGRSDAIAVVIGIVLVATSAIASGGLEWNDVAYLVWPVVAVLAADVVRGQRERADAEEARKVDAARRALVEADRRRAEERLALARDLHDSVAHAMATINVQAGVAAHVLGRDERQTADALEAIRLASRDVLDELGVMLVVMREGDGAARHPVADLRQLDGLVESSRRAGVQVEVQRVPVTDVPQPVSAAAFRVVQEGLTNVARHAPGARAVVVVDRPAGTVLSVEVRDDGVPGVASARDGRGSMPTSPGAGVGLVGVRERAQVTGGRCEIGPLPGGGFRLRVVWDGAP